MFSLNVFPCPRNFPCPRARLKIWSRETGSAIPSRASLLILHTEAESGAYSQAPLLPPAFHDGLHITHTPPSSRSRVYQVTQMRADGAHCRESAGTGPEVVKVVRLTGTYFLFSYPHGLTCMYNIILDRFTQISSQKKTYQEKDPASLG